MDLKDKIMREYGIDYDSITEYHAGNYGKTYKITEDDDQWILKLVPDADAARIPEILSFQKHVAQQGIKSPNPEFARKNKLCSKLKIDEITYALYCYPLLSGKNAEEELSCLIDEGRIYTLGREVAKLHEAMNNFERRELSSITKWNYSDCLFNLETDPDKSVPAKAVKIYNDTKDDILSSVVNRGEMIHGDLHFDNILYSSDDNSFSFIDLEDIILGNREMDLAILIFDLPVILKHKAELNSLESIINDLLRGYNSVSALEHRQVAAIPKYLKLLETACFINYYMDRDAQGGWLGDFFDGRQENILSEKPYIDADFAMFAKV